MLQFLRTHPLLQGVPDHEIEAAAEAMDTAEYEPGDMIIREGETGQDCLFVAEGVAQVYTRNLIGKPVWLADVGPGSVIGEIALLMNERRSANIRALTKVTVYRMERGVFERLSESGKMFHESLHLSAEIRYVHNLLRKTSIWSAIPDSELRGLAEITVRRKVRRGDMITREGEAPEHLYMITGGRFEVRDGGKRKALLGPGDCYGEMALLADNATADTFIALEDGELLVLGKTEFTFVLLQYPPVLRQFAALLHLRRPELTLSEPFLSAIPDREKGNAEAGKGRFDIDLFAGRWVELLFGLGGVFVFFTLLAAFLQHPVWNDAALLSGAVVGPVTFIAYIRHSQLLGFRPSRLLLVFLMSAAVAIPIAWILQRLLLAPSAAVESSSAIAHWRVPFTVAVIEEAAKLLICIGLLQTRRYRFLMDAIVFGAAAGMGFAAVETILYGWVQLLAQESAGSMLAVIWIRALLSPFGHGTWTAIASAGIWFALLQARQAAKRSGEAAGRWRDRLLGIGLPLSAVGLHTLWNADTAPGLWHMLIMLAVGALGLGLLFWLLRMGREQERLALISLNPTLEDTYMTADQRLAELMEEEAGTPSSGAMLLCENCATQSPPHVRYCARCGQSLRLTHRGG